MLALAAATASAQPTPVFRAGLDLVDVTVTVRDGKGGLVSDLTVDDFVVREDGRPQGLEIFAPAARPEEREELALNLGMLFDTSESMRKDLKLSQESAIRFLDAIPRARDLLLIFFDRDIRISRYNSENQQGIFGRILEAKGEGYTALYDAIAVYLSRVADTPAARCWWSSPTATTRRARCRRRRCRGSSARPSVTIYPVAFPGEHKAEHRGRAPGPLLPPLDRRAERRPGLPADGLAGAGRHLPVDPGRAGHAVRPRLRLGQREARRQVPADHRRAEAAGPEGPPPPGLRRAEGPAAPQAEALRQEVAGVEPLPRAKAGNHRRDSRAAGRVTAENHGSGGSGGRQAEGGRPSSDSTFRSSSRRRFCISGSRAKTALDLSQARFPIAG